MDGDPNPPMAALAIRIPREDIDGAIAELHVHGDGSVSAEIRIPGPAAP